MHLKMAELPDEIWLQIVEYLPEHQVRRLYSINRALFNISLDFRYRTVSLGIHPNNVLESTVPSILGNRLLSSRPTSLEVTFHGTEYRPTWEVKEPRKSSVRVPTFLRAVFSGRAGQKRRSSKQIVLVPSTATKLAQLAIHALPSLTRVAKVSFTYNQALDTSSNVAEDAPLIIPKVLQSVGNRLRSLHIQSLCAGHLPSSSESDSLHFGLLESFSLDALTPFHTVITQRVVVDRVTPFLLAHKSTIRDVSLAVDHAWDNSTLYQALRRMPRLSILDLSLRHVSEVTYVPCLRWFSASDCDLAHSVIPDHRDHFEKERALVVALGRQNLRSLTLRFATESPDKAGVRKFFKDDLASFTFPHVNALTVTLPLHEFVEAPEVVGQFSASLVSLTLKGRYQKSSSAGDLDAFCNLIGGFPCLRHLAVSLGRFQETELFTIGSNLPHLRTLSVTYADGIVDWEGHYVPRLYPDYVLPWTLGSFDFQTCENPKTVPMSGMDDCISGQVAIHLPNVGWINNKARQDCLPFGWHPTAASGCDTGSGRQ